MSKRLIIAREMSFACLSFCKIRTIRSIGACLAQSRHTMISSWLHDMTWAWSVPPQLSQVAHKIDTCSLLSIGCKSRHPQFYHGFSELSSFRKTFQKSNKCPQVGLKSAILAVSHLSSRKAKWRYRPGAGHGGSGAGINRCAPITYRTYPSLSTFWTPRGEGGMRQPIDMDASFSATQSVWAAPPHQTGRWRRITPCSASRAISLVAGWAAT